MRREAQADQVDQTDTPERSRSVPPPTSTDGTDDTKPEDTRRSRSSKMKVPSFGRSRSHHSAVTDRGQASSMEELSKLESLAPMHGSAEATRIAPERQSSNLNILTTGTAGHVDENKFPTSPGLSTPGIVVSDHPDAPATLIPATDGSSTRPTKGGIAYPFSLKVEGREGHSRNASMLTLESVDVGTPPVSEPAELEKGLGANAAGGLAGENEKGSDAVRPNAIGQESTMSATKENETEALYTNGPGAGLFSSGIKPEEVGGAEKVERPPVERFETALEDLNTLTGKAPKT